MPVNRENFRSLLQAAADCVLVIDASGVIFWCNAQAERLFGFTADELVGQPVEILVPTHLRKRHAGFRQGFVKRPHNRLMGENLSLLAQRKDGQTFPVEISLSYSGSDRAIQVMALVQDVSERRRMETALRDSEGRYRSMTDDVLDSLAVGTLVLDADHRVVWFNRALEELFGPRRADWLGRGGRDLFREQIAPRLENGDFHLDRLDRDCRNGCSYAHHEWHLPGVEGQAERWLAHHCQPITSGLYRGGRIEHFYDITGLKELERLREAQFAEQIRSLESEVSHLARLVRPERVPVTSRSLGGVPLQQHLPEVFAELLEDYLQIIDQALENRVLKTGLDLSPKLAKLAENLGFLSATPRDLIDLHRQVLLRNKSLEHPERLKGLIDEGYLLLIELMGDLTHFYRRKAVLDRLPDERPAAYIGESYGD